MAYAMGGEKSRIRSAAPAEAFAAGVLVALGTDGLLYMANAALAVAQHYPALGLSEVAAVSADVTDGNLIAVVGKCDYCDGATGLSPGQTLWAGETEGTVTTTRPTTHLDIAQAVGRALTATTFILDVADTYEQIGITA
jgi:hypothetical protein